jgi:hypothetical protein
MSTVRSSIVELSIKCLLKMTKVLEDIIDDVDIAAVLLEMHVFLFTQYQQGRECDMS